MTNTIYELWWCSEDGQGSMPMGEYDTEALATAAIDDAGQEALDECADEEQKDHFLAGTWHINPKRRDTDE